MKQIAMTNTIVCNCTGKKKFYLDVSLIANMITMNTVNTTAFNYPDNIVSESIYFIFCFSYNLNLLLNSLSSFNYLVGNVINI